MTATLSALIRAIYNSIFAPAARTASANGTGLDLADYEGMCVLSLESAAGTGTAPTLDFKLQESDDNTTFTDVAVASLFSSNNSAAGAFVQVTGAAASVQSRTVDASQLKRYVRGVFTIGGTTPSFTCQASLIGQKKYQS